MERWMQTAAQEIVASGYRKEDAQHVAETIAAHYGRGNARERLERIEWELNAMRTVVDRLCVRGELPEFSYWEIRGAWSRVSGVLADHGTELQKVEVPGD